MHSHTYVCTQFQIVQRIHEKKKRLMKNCTLLKISYSNFDKCIVIIRCLLLSLFFCSIRDSEILIFIVQEQSCYSDCYWDESCFHPEDAIVYTVSQNPRSSN